jgi:hypothetical protein
MNALMTKYAAIADQVTKARADAAQRIAAVRADAHLSDEGKTKKIADLQDELRGRVDGLAEEGRQLRARLERESAEQPIDAAAQQQRDRAWDRMRPALENGVPWNVLLAEVQEAGDVPAILALGAEVPGWSANRVPVEQRATVLADARRDVGRAVDAAVARTDRGEGGVRAKTRALLQPVGDVVTRALADGGAEAAGRPVDAMVSAISDHYARQEMASFGTAAATGDATGSGGPDAA